MQTTILIGLFICHTLADYTHLSMPFMLSAKRLGKPLFPILVHAFIHAFLMFGFLVFFVSDSKTLILSSSFQLVSHFLIDALKGRMNGWFSSLQNPANKWHWIVFGIDQLLHTLVIIMISDLASYI